MHPVVKKCRKGTQHVVLVHVDPHACMAFMRVIHAGGGQMGTQQPVVTFFPTFMYAIQACHACMHREKVGQVVVMNPA
jgi:hypothetical protein